VNAAEELSRDHLDLHIFAGEVKEAEEEDDDDEIDDCDVNEATKAATTRRTNKHLPRSNVLWTRSYPTLQVPSIASSRAPKNHVKELTNERRTCVYIADVRSVAFSRVSTRATIPQSLRALER
jgi:hypothetical protein